jgi:beta-glucosidase
VRADEVINVAVDVTNTGSRDGDEVVQLYLSRPGVAGAPIRALGGVARVHLAAGTTQRVSFSLGDRALSIVDSSGVRRIVPGRVDLWVGGSQPDARPGLAKAAGARVAFEITTASILPD